MPIWIFENKRVGQLGTNWISPSCKITTFLRCQKSCLNTFGLLIFIQGAAGSFFTSYLPFTDIRESCLYAFSVNTYIWNNFVWILWKFITYTIIWVKISFLWLSKSKHYVHLLNSHHLCKKNIKLSYLKAFFIQKAIIFTKKTKNMHVKCSIHIKCVWPPFPYVYEWQKWCHQGTCAALCIEIGKPNLFRQNFWQNLIFRANNCWFY